MSWNQNCLMLALAAICLASCGCDDSLTPVEDAPTEARVAPPPPPPTRPAATEDEPETAVSPAPVGDPVSEEGAGEDEDAAPAEEPTVVGPEDTGDRSLTPEEARAEIEKLGGRVSADETDGAMKVFLNRTTVGDEQLSVVQYLPEVQVLNLTGTSVGDDGLKHLHGLSQLKRIYAAHTNITEFGADALKQQLPDCEIYR